MLVEGFVSAVNEDLLFFTVDGATTVHAVLAFVAGTCSKLPVEGSKVRVTSPHFRATKLGVKCLVLCRESEIQGEFSATPSNRCETFLNVARNLAALDIITLDQNLRTLRDHFTISKGSYEELIVNIYRNVGELREKFDACEERTLPKFSLKTVDEINFVAANPEKYYKKFPEWSFGCHFTKPEFEFLIGQLEVHATFGINFFTDQKRSVPCIITNHSGLKITNYFGKFVLVREYFVFTEIYNFNKIDSLQCLLIDLSDVITLPFTWDYKQKLVVEVVPEGFGDSFTCSILAKSLPFVTPQRKIQFWLELGLNEDNSKRGFLCCDSAYVEIYPLLQEGSTYKIYHKQVFMKLFNKELSKLAPRVPQLFLQTGNGIIVPQETSAPDAGSIMDEEEAQRGLATLRNLVTFQGKICKKKFAPSLSSRTPKIVDNSNIGTPGPKTHLLEFNAGDERNRLTVYLNNFENLLMPNCLVPNMRVVVRNVVAQNGRYYKSTPLTSIQVLSYEPEFLYETANLSYGDRGVDWGYPCFLSAPLPVGVVVWATITNFFILGLKINNESTENQKPLSMKVTLIVKDQLGESKIIAKNSVAKDLVCLMIFGYPSPRFEEWCRSLTFLESYEFIVSNQKRQTTRILEESQRQLVEAIDAHFDAINAFGGVDLDVKCRKIEEQKENGSSVFILMDVRKDSLY